MSLVDRTNERIPLSQHLPEDLGTEAGVAELYVDADQDSSFEPSHWVHIGFTDVDHDADRIKLTYEEAGLLHDRLGLILGRPSAEKVERARAVAMKMHGEHGQSWNAISGQRLLQAFESDEPVDLEQIRTDVETVRRHLERGRRPQEGRRFWGGLEWAIARLLGMTGIADS